MKDLRLIMLLLSAIGTGVLFYSFTMEYYTDQKYKSELNDLANSGKFQNHAEFKKFYYSEISKIKTAKRHLMDAGSGRMIFGLSLLTFLLITKSKKPTDLKNLKFPGKKKIFLLANISWLALIPGTFWYYIFRMYREDYPPFIDTLAIPLMGQVSLLIILIIPLNLFLWLNLRKRVPGGPVAVIADVYNIKAIFIEIFWDILLLINIVITFGLIIDGDHISIPANIVFAYILLILRSGPINRINKLNCTM